VKSLVNGRFEDPEEKSFRHLNRLPLA